MDDEFWISYIFHVMKYSDFSLNYLNVVKINLS